MSCSRPGNSSRWRQSDFSFSTHGSPPTSAFNCPWLRQRECSSARDGRFARASSARALAVSLGAQVAVAPLLILSFGGVPLLSPPVNLVAAPMVASATVLGAIGVAGVDPLLEVAVWLAELVLDLARGAASWPQVGWEALAGLGGLAVGSSRFRRLRGPIAMAAAVAVVTLLLGTTTQAPDSSVLALDVGQGDALLLSGGDGRYALVDGGPDPVTLIERLGSMESVAWSWSWLPIRMPITLRDWKV